MERPRLKTLLSYIIALLIRLLPEAGITMSCTWLSIHVAFSHTIFQEEAESSINFGPKVSEDNTYRL